MKYSRRNKLILSLSWLIIGISHVTIELVFVVAYDHSFNKIFHIMGQRFIVNKAFGIWIVDSGCTWSHRQSHDTQPQFSQIFYSNKHVLATGTHVIDMLRPLSRAQAPPLLPPDHIWSLRAPLHLTKSLSVLHGGRIVYCYLVKCFECYTWIIS